MKNVVSRDMTIDLVRVIACLAVVLMHVISVFWYPIPVQLKAIKISVLDINNFLSTNDIGVIIGSWQWYLLSFADAITRFSVPVFVMISGAMVLKKKEISIKYGFNKFFYLCKIIILWGGIMTLLLYFINLAIGEHQSVTYYIQTLINGGGVFWFLYMLMPLYLSSAVYKAIVKDSNALFMFVFLWVMMTIILPSIKAYYPGLTTNIKFEYLTQFSTYSGYFVLGYALYKAKSSKVFGLTLKTTRKLSYIIIVLMLVIMTFGKPIAFFHNFSSPVCVLMSLCIYWTLINIKVNRNEWITKLASSTLGIYAMHMLYIKLFTFFVDVEFLMRNELFFLNILCIWISVFICSYCTVRLLNFLPIIRNI